MNLDDTLIGDELDTLFSETLELSLSATATLEGAGYDPDAQDDLVGNAIDSIVDDHTTMRRALYLLLLSKQITGADLERAVSLARALR